MRVAALDLSSRTGWAVWNGSAGRPMLGTKKLVGWDYDEGDFLEFYRLWLGDFLRVHQPELIAIERWFLPEHADGKTIGNQIGLSYFTRWACKAARIKSVYVTAAQWRKHAFGSAANNGTDWKRRATQRCDHLGWEYSDHNAAEAGLILDWAIVTVAKHNPPWRDDMLMPRIAA